MAELTPSEALSDMEYWERMAPEGWELREFGGRRWATFYDAGGPPDQAGSLIEVNRGHLRFFEEKRK